MNHEEIKNLVAAFSLDALDLDDQQALEAHLQEGCPECEALMREMHIVTSHLPYAAAAQTPPSTLKDRILGRIAERSEPLGAPVPVSEEGIFEAGSELLEKSRQRWLQVSWSLGVTLILVIIGFSWYTTELKRDYNQQKSQVDLSEQLIRELRTQLTEKQRILEVIQSPQVRLVDLNGQAPAPDAGGKIVWDPDNRKAIFYVFNLPPPPADKEYQLWMIQGTLPVDAGVFPVDAQGSSQPASIDTIADSPNLSAFAVTLEPKGGVPQPTGSIYLLGAVDQG